MPRIKPVEEASQDFTADFASLRDDVAKLSSSLSEFIRTHSVATTNTGSDVVDNARQKTTTGLESTIERNPLAAILIALGAGILVGLLSRGRK